MSRVLSILLVEDSPTDTELTKEALKVGSVVNNFHVVEDGPEAIAFLRQEGKFAHVQRPDLIILDLNLPKKDGREVLAEIKNDEKLRAIPVVVLTTSNEESDVKRAYDLHANCYITKPFDLDRFIAVIKDIERFWFTTVRLPVVD